MPELGGMPNIRERMRLSGCMMPERCSIPVRAPAAGISSCISLRILMRTYAVCAAMR